MNKFILNADDFGMSIEFNNAVLYGILNGEILKSASLVANGEAFDDAVERIIPKCENLSVGVHLNIIEGKSLSENIFLLTDSENNFNNSYIDLILKCSGKNKKIFLEQIEKEFRTQIEKILSKTKVSHIDSHVHTHAIPEIFELTCKLAQEYEIPYIRTQREKFYIVPNIKKTLSSKFLVNILKNVLLNYFTLKNKKLIKKYNIKTNDYILGVLYTSMMDDKSIYYGLKNIKNKEQLAEALIHPCKYSEKILNSHSEEFEITQNKKLADDIIKLGFEISNYY